MSSTTDLIEQLLARWPARRPEDAIVRAVQATFKELDERPAPTDLKDLAAKRGIRRIEVVDLPTDGLIFGSTDRGYTVRLNQTHSARRRRFTLAHEIVHTILFELDMDRRTSALECEDGACLGVEREIESLCDIGAASILMPERKVLDVLKRHGVGVAGLDRVVRTFDVSYHAAALRVRNVVPLLRGGRISRAEIAIVMWQKVGLRFCARWLVGKASLRLDERGLAVAPQDPAYKLFMGDQYFSRRVWMSLGGPFEDYYVDGLPLARGSHRQVLTVVVFGPTPDQSVLPRSQKGTSDSQLDLLT